MAGEYSNKPPTSPEAAERFTHAIEEWRTAIRARRAAVDKDRFKRRVALATFDVQKIAGTVLKITGTAVRTLYIGNPQPSHANFPIRPDEYYISGLGQNEVYEGEAWPTVLAHPLHDPNVARHTVILPTIREVTDEEIAAVNASRQEMA